MSTCMLEKLFFKCALSSRHCLFRRSVIYRNYSTFSDDDWVLREDTSNDELFYAIGTADEQQMDAILGRGTLRSSNLEAAVRRLADGFHIYDTIDKFLLSDELKQFEDSHKRGDIKNDSIDTAADHQVSDNLLHRAHNYFFKEYNIGSLPPNDNYAAYEELDYSIPVYSLETQRQIYQRLADYVKNYLSGDPQRTFLSELGHILQEASQMPALEVFYKAMNDLLERGYLRPAEMVLDCLVAANVPLDHHIYALGLRVLAYNESVDRFKQMAKLLPLKDTHHLSPVFKGMSRYWTRDPVEWFPSTNYYTSLAKRFSTSPGRTSSSNYQNVTNSLADGLYYLGMHNQLDLCLREAYVDQNKLAVPLIDINFKAARQSKDAHRAQWTWERFKELKLGNQALKSIQGGKLFYIRAFTAAQKSGNDDLYRDMKAFVFKHEINRMFGSLRLQ